MEGYSIETLEAIVGNSDSKADRVAIAKELLAERFDSLCLRLRALPDRELEEIIMESFDYHEAKAAFMLWNQRHELQSLYN